jgi:hypothetical protein
VPRHDEQKTLAYTADELFAVVADVKDYPAFVPWCSGARIQREDQREIVADLVIGFGLFQESFTSQVKLDRPRQVLVSRPRPACGTPGSLQCRTRLGSRCRWPRHRSSQLECGVPYKVT